MLWTYFETMDWLRFGVALVVTLLALRWVIVNVAWPMTEPKLLPPDVAIRRRGIMTTAAFAISLAAAWHIGSGHSLLPYGIFAVTYIAQYLIFLWFCVDMWKKTVEPKRLLPTEQAIRMRDYYDNLVILCPIPLSLAVFVMLALKDSN